MRAYLSPEEALEAVGLREQVVSPENVAIIRGAFESFGAAGMDAVVDLLDPAVELYGAVGGIEQGAVVRGVTGVADALSVDSDIWAECRFELQRLVDAGDRVVALVREQRRGRGSGIDVQADIALIYTLAEGRIVRIEPYMSQSDALEAVGLSEQAMSQENVEMLVRALEAWNRDDMDTMLALCDPDVEYVPTGMFPGMEPIYRGHDGFLAFWRDFRGVWETLQIEVEEVRDLGEQVVARLGFEGRGRAGLEVRRQFGNLWTFRNGLAVHVRAYADWPEALQAAGLSEQAMSQENVELFRRGWRRRIDGDAGALLDVPHLEDIRPWPRERRDAWLESRRAL